jgi:sporulation protein YlmC with PRC-barrel domain
MPRQGALRDRLDMTAFALRPAPRRARRRPLSSRPHRRVAPDPRLVSVAGAVGARVYSADARLIGVLDDVLVDPVEERYPPVVGLMVRVLHERTFVPIDAVADIHSHAVLLTGPLQSRAAARPPGLVALAHDVLDRQIVDIDGANVARVSDLVLGREGESFRLVGVDVSMRTLFRRLGPDFLRQHVSPERVYDWEAVGAFSERGADGGPSILHLTSAAADLRQRGSADVAQLLADLPTNERDQLASEVASA